MEGAGGTTRMGSRSSTRHGPASVFQGKVRRWRKSWTQVASPSPSASGSRILLYKWVPLAPPANANGGKEVTAEETTPPKVLRFLPVVVVQAQRKKEEERKAAEEAEALNQEENEQPQAMDTTDGSLHEDIPTNPSEELNAANDHTELGTESLNDESIPNSKGNGLLLDASKEGQAGETEENLDQLGLESAQTELGAS
ncbi:hypothetical protein CY35_11G067500 [Sphagnum magellanicum]|nr:hypothetical protein CY35_11G067500 [Sphagnum magellanicum]